MSLALVTIIAPLAPDRVMEAQVAIDALGNPARDEIATALDVLDGEAGTHFVSLHAILSRDGARGHLALELSADGTPVEAIARILAAIGDRLRPVFMIASDWSAGIALNDYLTRHLVSIGPGWFDNPGVAFAGTPGLTVGRIRREQRLSAHVAGLLGQLAPAMRALDRLEAIRAALARDPDFARELGPATPSPPYDPPGEAALIARLAGSFISTFLWPVGLAILVVGLAAGALVAGQGPASLVGGVWNGLWGGLLAALLAVLVAAIWAYTGLRRAEQDDWVDAAGPDRATLAAMFSRENRGAQNHMISITQRKPGVLRAFTLRAAFWIVGQLAARSYRPGFLSDIGTIHVARWVTPPGSPDLLFFSNYDSSWESYLEDFITKAHKGLTAIWSNCIGFPRTSNLFQDGATDGERFKRFARHSMQPTRFWYSAYPRLTTTEIRTNAQVRQGLSGAMTEDEATRWLALFGSAERPISTMASSEIQSIVFGGLKFLKYGTCLLIALPDDRSQARSWLRAVRPHVAFNDGRRFAPPDPDRPDEVAVVTLALGAPGLAKLGLAQSGLETFPFAFLEGMVTEPRGRILGDVGQNAPASWHWGQTQPDAALLVYGQTETAVAALHDKLAQVGSRWAMPPPTAIPLETLEDGKREPFGFADGISQPVIRGTYKALRNVDPIHLVEPGEFVLGYPDNRGNLPPGPTLAATLDPDNLLPLQTAADDFERAMVETPRAVGAHGSFLVIRQLEQDVERFHAYCAEQAEHLADRWPPPYRVTPSFVAAKLVGRWQDGSSLVRHPYEPRSGSGVATKETLRPTTHPAGQDPIEHPARPRIFGDNDFLFGTEDPEALRCPFGAHVRRSNPRDSLDPGSSEQVGITNRHRIMRVGRRYAPAPGQNPGLLFMCLNGDIERQFEFVQQTWLRSPSFHGLSCEKDPLLGDGEAGACGFTIPSRDGPVRLAPLPPMVTMRGGGYFFLPGKRLIDYLCVP